MVKTYKSPELQGLSPSTGLLSPGPVMSLRRLPPPYGVAQTHPTQGSSPTIHQGPGRRKLGISPSLQTPVEMPFQPWDKHLSTAKQASVTLQLSFQDKRLASSSVAKGPIVYFSQSKGSSLP